MSDEFPSLIAEICHVCRQAGRPICRAEIHERLSRSVRGNVLAVTIAQNLFKHLSRRPAGKRVREKYGARTVYWPKGHKPPKHRWIPKERRALRAMYPHMQSADVARILGRDVGAVYREAFLLGLKKSEAFNKSTLNGRMHKGHGTERGAAHRFQKGIVPWNKGTHFLAAGRSAETRFRKGQQSANYQPPGSLRENADGYIDMKVKETGLRGWRALHSILWEDANGPVPKGHVLIFKDRDKLNVCIENLECITLAENMRRNTIHNRYPKPIVQTIQLLGQLKRRLREKSGGPEGAPVRNARIAARRSKANGRGARAGSR